MSKNKKVLLPLLFLAVLLITGCSGLFSGAKNSNNNIQSTMMWHDPDAIDMTDYYKDYKETGGEVALVTDNGKITDHSFNEAAYKGVRTYTQAAGVSYSFYSAKSNTEKEYLNAVNTAIKNNARLIICAGSHFSKAVGALQDSYPDIDFLLLDGVPENESGEKISISKNVHCITYHEEQAGYLAGYMSVLEGFTSFGFIGGESLPSVMRYGYGFLQGLDDAADSLGTEQEIHVNYWYSGTFEPNQEIEATAATWYASGTEVIFACGGSIYESVLDAADDNDGLLIGVDVDLSDISERFLTSAMKGIQNSVILALDEYYAAGNTWPADLSGLSDSYGASDKCIALPVSQTAWRFENVAIEDYLNIYSLLKQEKLSVSDDISAPPGLDIRVNYLHS